MARARSLRHACSRAIATLVRDLLTHARAEVADTGAHLAGPPRLVVRGFGPNVVVVATPELSFVQFGLDVRVPALVPDSHAPAVSDLPTPVMVGCYLAERSRETVLASLDPRDHAYADAMWREASWGTVDRSGAAALGRRLRADPRPTGLLLVLDGAAGHGPKAPRAEDSRAGPSDDEAWAALASGDPQAFDDLDVSLAEHLGATAPALWPLLRHAADGRAWDAELLWRGAPYGVGRAVASWRPAQPEPASGV